ncbi:LLM class flavin-dependent oxidoreductase [Humitalea sp. 24SJ18S-53]|uniref:LLM class flavin-dependent oxidoreductase n=1 Tax=Humitalea sp. 24SJ18S-53 TaxID=3422307 RepID=UPI003D672BD0
MDIGIFLPTGTRGYLISSTAPLNEPTYDLNHYVVTQAERYGCEFALSMVKFRGFGGESRYWNGALEPFTLISALAAVTSRIRLISTASSLVMPPAVVARMAATMDSIAPGRCGINVVTGWQKAEYAQMGAWPGNIHFDNRYDYVTEYVEVMQQLWRDGRSDFRGTYFQMDDCRLEPQPANKIDLVMAGGSARGLDFAAKYCDYNFCSAPGTINQPEACEGPTARLKAAGGKYGRDLKALVRVSVIAAATDAAAEAKWDLYRRGTDTVALAWSKEQAETNQAVVDPHSTGARFVNNAGESATPTSAMKLIGSYATIARHLDTMANVPGLAGAMLSFDDFREGIDQFGQHIQPLMASRASQAASAFATTG